MPIQHAPIDCEDICIVNRWIINDIDALAEIVAFVMAGASLHAEKIIAETRGTNPRLRKAIDSAINKIYLSPQIENQEMQPVWHRDGLLFQAISWTAATLQKPKTSVIAVPHIIKAHKGLDGLLLNLEGGEVCLTIFEDKAGNASNLIAKVMAEFQQMEQDETYKAEELLQESSVLLSMHKPEGWEDIIADAFWLRNRKYRASLASLDSHCTEEGAKALFKAFKDSVPGVVDRRTGHLMASSGVRAFFRSFASKVVDTLEKKKSEEAIV